MTKRTTGALLAAAVLATASALPLAAGAAIVTGPPNATSTTYVMDSVASQNYRAGGFPGVLRLTVSRDGSIVGTYRDEYDGLPEVVAGGLQPGGRIWLNVKGYGLMYGTFHDGVLHAVVQNGDTDPTHFDATPTP
jgi:hypothetical protein